MGIFLTDKYKKIIFFRKYNIPLIIYKSYNNTVHSVGKNKHKIHIINKIIIIFS
jgi:hypothetical protein